jgi:outer membrane protein assembly factor BamB
MLWPICIVSAIAIVFGMSVYLTYRAPAPEISAPEDSKVRPLPIDPDATWPIFRGDAALTGVANASLQLPLDRYWRFRTEGPVQSSPVIADGRVYVGSDDGTLFCVDAARGQELWRYTTQDVVEAPPLVVDDAVVVGSHDGSVYCLDAANGELRWRIETGGRIAGSANLAMTPDGAPFVVVPSHDANLYALRLDDGEALWTYATQNYVNATPAIRDGEAVFGGCDEKLHVVGLEDGRGRHAPIDSYVGAGAALLFGHAYLPTQGGVLHAFDLSGGRSTWRFARESAPMLASPAVQNRRVYVGCHDGNLYCLDASNGEELWRYSAGGAINSSPVAAGDVVVFGSENGRLHAVRTDNGRAAWRYELGQPVGSSPAVAGGAVIVGCDDGYVYAFGPRRGDDHE